MAKYLLLKHYRGAPAAVNDVPMDEWAPAEVGGDASGLQIVGTLPTVKDADGKASIDRTVAAVPELVASTRRIMNLP